jgi:hypothetical protein
MGIDYTDEVARFSDQLCADTLAKFISSEGIPCDVETLKGPGLANCRVMVRRALLGELIQALKLTQVAKYEDPASAEVVAGRLAREKIPCTIFGGTRNVLGGLGFAGIPWNDTRELMAYSVAVPHVLLARAQRVLTESEISEAELTKLALNASVDPDDPS